MSHETEPDWLLLELGEGLKKLRCLSLEGQPSADDLGGTLLGWYEAISTRWYDEQEDRPRFQAGFRELMRTCKRWPAPSQFLDAMPKLAPDYRPRADYAPRLTSDESTRIGQQHIGQILEMLGMKTEPEEQPS